LIQSRGHRPRVSRKPLLRSHGPGKKPSRHERTPPVPRCWRSGLREPDALKPRHLLTRCRWQRRGDLASRTAWRKRIRSSRQLLARRARLSGDSATSVANRLARLRASWRGNSTRTQCLWVLVPVSTLGADGTPRMAMFPRTDHHVCELLEDVSCTSRNETIGRAALESRQDRAHGRAATH